MKHPSRRPGRKATSRGTAAASTHANRPEHGKPTSEFRADGEIEIRGREVFLRGALAREVAKLAAQAGVSRQQVFNECLRVGLPRLLARFRAPAASNAGNLKAQPVKGRHKPGG